MRHKLLSAAALVMTSALVTALPARAEDNLALARKVAEANNAFGVALYREFAKDPGNLVFSPFSLSSALALTATGARGQTEKELWQALRLDLPREQVAAGYAGIAVEFAKSTRDEMASLTVANSLWPQQGYTLKPEFLDVAHRQFGAAVTPLDYAKPDAAAATINGWIEAKTAGLIQQLVSPTMFTSQTRLTLCNAVHFKAAWMHEFAVRATGPAPFISGDGLRVDVPTMRRVAWFQSGDTTDCRLLRLDYAAGFEMVIVLPKRVDGLDELERVFDAGVVDRWLGASAEREFLSVALPKFRTAAFPECARALRALGVREAYRPDVADFTGLSREDEFCVGDVLHKAVIDVNELGTEAAAATAVVMRAGATYVKLPEPKPFKVDHPFLFFIRETRTGAILFMGRIVDPRAE